MADDKNNKNDKITGIGGTSGSKIVERTHSVGEVEQVKKTDAVSGPSAVSSKGKRVGTRIMSKAEMQEFFKLVDQEAEKLFANSGFSKEHQEIVQQAVKMSVNAGAIIEDESDDEKK